VESADHVPARPESKWHSTDFIATEKTNHHKSENRQRRGGQQSRQTGQQPAHRA
jgi:hypothetical protein